MTGLKEITFLLLETSVTLYYTPTKLDVGVIYFFPLYYLAHFSSLRDSKRKQSLHVYS